MSLDCNKMHVDSSYKLNYKNNNFKEKTKTKIDMNRSQMMANIRSKNTGAELRLKIILRGTFIRQHPKIYGNPDFGLKVKKIAIFLDGCFWHKCPKHYHEPKTNKKFWISKIERNTQRDKEVNKKLKSKGYKVIRIWEHELKYPHKKILKKIKVAHQRQ